MSKATKTPATVTAAAPAKVKAVKAVKTPEQIELDAIAKSEKSLAKYGAKIVAGSVRRAPEGSIYGKKLLVTINTRGLDGEFDGQTREVATSDVHQVHYTPEVAAELKKVRSADKRAAASADRAAEAEVAAVDLDALEASL